MNTDNTNEMKGEEIKQLMEDNDIDEETAEKAQELINEGLDEEDAVIIAEEM